jgi:hypothetical protein
VHLSKRRAGDDYRDDGRLPDPRIPARIRQGQAYRHDGNSPKVKDDMKLRDRAGAAIQAEERQRRDSDGMRPADVGQVVPEILVLEPALGSFVCEP